MAWLSPAAWAEEAYQQAYSVLAIGSGGMAGRLGDALGTMPAVIKSGFLPEPHTDFIMAAAGQELGIAGCAGIIFLELWLTIRCLSLGTKAPDREGRLFCAGMAAWIGGQSLINMGVASGLLPNTGLTLPFVSYGLTSLISLYMGLGIAVNVGIQRKQSGSGRERKNIVHW